MNFIYECFFVAQYEFRAIIVLPIAELPFLLLSCLLVLRLFNVEASCLILNGNHHIRLRHIQLEESHDRGIIAIAVSSPVKLCLQTSLSLRFRMYLVIRMHGEDESHDAHHIYM